MAKQHETFPGEQREMPDLDDTPEVNKPGDPKVPDLPQEDPVRQPEEIPPVKGPEEAPDNAGAENSKGF